MTRPAPPPPIRLTLAAAVRWAERHLPDALDLPERPFLAAITAEAARFGLPRIELVNGSRALRVDGSRALPRGGRGA